MRNLLFLFSCAVVLLLSVAFGGQRTGGQQCGTGLTAAKQASGAVSNLGIKIYLQVARSCNKTNATSGNTIFSPVSISLGLALLEAGASGDTRKELQAHLGSQQPDSSSSYQALQHLLQIRPENDPTTASSTTIPTKLSVANGLFYKQGLNLHEAYIRKTSECFDTEVQSAPFGGSNAEQAREQVNRWVSNKTCEKIPELLKPGAIDPLAVAVLANAVHMKAAWKTPFPQLKQLPFYRNGQTDQVQTTSFMIAYGDYWYGEDDLLQYVEIPYQGDQLSMNIFLPKQRDGIQAVEDVKLQSFTKSQKSALGYGMREMALKIPKFGARTTVDLRDVLQELRVKKMFTDAAEFTRMTSERVQVSTAVHEAYIKVNENGTEAAAATGFVVVNVSASAEPRVNFTADHPFIYIIWHVPTGVPVFMGKINYIEEE